MQAVEIDCAWVTEFVTQVCRDFGLPLPEKIEIKPVRCGRYRYKTNRITLPKFIFREGIWYVKAYIIHELCHSVVWGHGDRFKRVEKVILARYGMKPLYAKAYVRALMVDGELVWCRGMNGNGW